MYKMLWLCLLLFIIIGCSPTIQQHNSEYPEEIPQKIIPIYLDKDFVGEEIHEIEIAFTQWNKALNNQIVFRINNINFNMSDHDIMEAHLSSGFIILKVNSSYIYTYYDNIEPNILAFTNKIGGNIVYIIRDRIGIGDLRYIMLHEIGHLLGADHTSTGLMYKYYSPEAYQCIDYATIKQVVIFENLNINKLNYCVH